MRLLRSGGLVLLILLCLPGLGQTEECTLGTGYPVSSSKLIITQVAHYLDRGDKDSLRELNTLERQDMFHMTEHAGQVEILARSGELVKVRLVGRPDIFWTVNSGLRCY